MQALHEFSAWLALDPLAAGLVLGLLCGLLLGVLLGLPARRRLRRVASEQQLAAQCLQAELASSERAYQNLEQSLQQSRQILREQFQQLAAQVLEEKNQSLTQGSQASLQLVLAPLREQLDNFRQRVNEVHDASLKGQQQLGHEIRQVLDMGLKMSDEAQNLAQALGGSAKTLGNWGEYQLEHSLQSAGLVAGEHYHSQASLQDAQGRRRMPDFLLSLPDGKHLILDSKASLADWQRAVAAPDEAERAAALQAHVRALRSHVRELAEKDYSALCGIQDPGFVLMFVPIEAAYIEALRFDGALFDHASAKNVILVSHTTLMPVLRTVASVWLMAGSVAKARALGELAGGLHRQVAVLAERLHKLGQSMAAANGHFNSCVTAIAGQQGLYAKAERFGEYSARSGKQLPQLQPSHADLELQRLESILPP